MFDPFKFLENRAANMTVTEAEQNDFVLYNVLQALSMDVHMLDTVSQLNDLSFSKLPRDIQARTFNSINGKRLNTRWCRAKTGTIQEKEDRIDHLMAVTGMSHSCAVNASKYGLVNWEDIEERYLRKFEPEKLVEFLDKQKKKVPRKKK